MVWLRRQLSTKWADERDLIRQIDFPWRNDAECSKGSVWAELENAFEHPVSSVTFACYFS